MIIDDSISFFAVYYHNCILNLNLSEMKKIVSNEIKEIEKSFTRPITPVDENFNWKKYVGYYQDLKNDNVDTKEKAWNHWIKYGEKEGTVYFDLNENTNLNKTKELEK